MHAAARRRSVLTRERWASTDQTFRRVSRHGGPQIHRCPRLVSSTHEVERRPGRRGLTGETRMPEHDSTTEQQHTTQDDTRDTVSEESPAAPAAKAARKRQTRRAAAAPVFDTGAGDSEAATAETVVADSGPPRSTSAAPAFVAPEVVDPAPRRRTGDTDHGDPGDTGEPGDPDDTGETGGTEGKPKRSGQASSGDSDDTASGDDDHHTSDAESGGEQSGSRRRRRRGGRGRRRGPENSTTDGNASGVE